MGDNKLRFGHCATIVRKTINPEGLEDDKYIGLEHIEQRTLHLNGHGFADDVSSTKSAFSKGDILFGKLRPYFRKVVRAPFKGVCSTDIWVVRSKNEVDQGFLYYWMASPEFVNFSMQGSEGTKMPRAKWEHVSRHEIPYFDKDEQRAIAHILGSLDDKIELNRKMNETLEAMAQALFKSWFVDFDPVIDNALAAGNSIPEELAEKATLRESLGDARKSLPEEIRRLFPDEFVKTKEMGWIPKGWKVSSFGEETKIVGGGTPKTKMNKYWGGDIPWFSVVDTPASSDVFVITTEKNITQTGLNESSARLVPKGTTIISARGTVGNLAVAGRSMTFNQSCYGLRSKRDAGDYFIFLTAQRMVEKLLTMAHGSVFSTITRQTFNAIYVAIPCEVLFRQFEQSVSVWFDRILLNTQHSQALAQLRDTVLSKLISGEIRISDTEQYM